MSASKVIVSARRLAERRNELIRSPSSSSQGPSSRPSTPLPCFSKMQRCEMPSVDPSRSMYLLSQQPLCRYSANGLSLLSGVGLTFVRLEAWLLQMVGTLPGVSEVNWRRHLGPNRPRDLDESREILCERTNQSSGWCRAEL